MNNEKTEYRVRFEDFGKKQYLCRKKRKRYEDRVCYGNRTSVTPSVA